MSQSVAGSGRPWQGTFIGVLDVIGTVCSFIFAVLILLFQNFMSGFLGGAASEGATELPPMFSKLISLFSDYTLLLGLVWIAFGVLGVFMARGAFRGQKWSVVTMVVFAVLGVLMMLVGLKYGFSIKVLIGFVWNVFLVYLGVMCMRHPYYNS